MDQPSSLRAYRQWAKVSAGRRSGLRWGDQAIQRLRIAIELAACSLSACALRSGRVRAGAGNAAREAAADAAEGDREASTQARRRLPVREGGCAGAHASPAARSSIERCALRRVASPRAEPCERWCAPCSSLLDAERLIAPRDCALADLAHCEKLGTSNFYWAFPAERTQKARHKQQRLQKREQELTESKLKQHERLDHAKAAVPDNEERKAARERYDTASARLHQLEQEEERLANIGNAKDFTETIQSAVKGINIYTGTMLKSASQRACINGTVLSNHLTVFAADNIFLLGEWLQAKAGGDKGIVQDFFQREDIDVENLDYMNLPPEAA